MAAPSNMNTENTLDFPELKQSIPCLSVTEFKINLDYESQMLINSTSDDISSSLHFHGSTNNNLCFLIVPLTVTCAGSSKNAFEGCTAILVSWIISHHPRSVFGVPISVLCGADHLLFARIKLYCSENSNKSRSRNSWHNEQSDSSRIERQCVSLNPGALSNTIICPCRKFADTKPGNANLPDDQNTDNSAVVQHNNNVQNAAGGALSEPGSTDTNNHGHNDDENDSSDNEGSGYDHDKTIRVEPIRVYRYNMNHVCTEIIQTNVAADNYNDWRAFAKAVYRVWQQRIADAGGHAPDVDNVDPDVCWPDSTTVFGRFVGGHFTDLNWPAHEWEAVRTEINCVRAFQIFQH